MNTRAVSYEPSNGRPRDPQIDRAIVQATRELLIEVGYADLTLAAVAGRAGTSKPALYRRWPSKFHLVQEVAFPDEGGTVPESTGDLSRDVRAMVTAAVEMMTDPIARAALPGLLLEIGSNPTLFAGLIGRFQDHSWGIVAERLSAYESAGAIREGVDSGALIEMIGGSVLLAMLIRPDAPLNQAWIDTVSDTLLRGLAR